MQDDWQKKYYWQITWPGEGHKDYSAYDGALYIGRIFEDLTTHNKKGWYRWAGGAHGRQFPKHNMPHNGWEPDAQKAAQAVETWYDQLRRLNGLEG